MLRVRPASQRHLAHLLVGRAIERPVTRRQPGIILHRCQGSVGSVEIAHRPAHGVLCGAQHGLRCLATTDSRFGVAVPAEGHEDAGGDPHGHSHGSTLQGRDRARTTHLNVRRVAQIVDAEIRG
jgi:hypothetical protein